MLIIYFSNHDSFSNLSNKLIILKKEFILCNQNYSKHKNNVVNINHKPIFEVKISFELIEKNSFFFQSILVITIILIMSFFKKLNSLTVYYKIKLLIQSFINCFFFLFLFVQTPLKTHLSFKH